jgi:hypothetical protein
MPHIAPDNIESWTARLLHMFRSERPAKVDELITFRDKLGASLTRAADTRRRLLDALLAEALMPDIARELEAAE